jgi:hypothetical protein
MNREEYVEYHQRLCDAARALSVRKNNDYAGDGGKKPFANFERVESMGVTTTTKGFLVRIVDKVSRLAEFSKTGRFEVTDESFEDTCQDIINYVCLMAAHRHATREPTPDTLH